VTLPAWHTCEVSAPWVPPSNDDEESVQEPELSDDADELDAGVFGAIGLFSMLAERVDAHEALAAADGWGGGQYVTYRVDGRTCVRAQIVGESRADTERLVRTLDDWVQSLPSAFAKVSVVDELIVLESCDPGASADLATVTAMTR
jgi:hypothetical protein